MPRLRANTLEKTKWDTSRYAVVPTTNAKPRRNTTRHITVCCTDCAWKFTGTPAEGHTAYAAHRPEH